MRRRALDRRSFYELGCVTIFLELLWIGSQFPTQAQEEFLFIPQSALYPGGISADPFFLPLEEAGREPHFPETTTTPPIRLT
ncbi:MAG: hypothetical protein KatS3mg115_1101 [Candidatus Poribacteria bacterium]|nr:MAG: hypothetical protein KatS3mg115_1101 [Candidatus Poribacteria bacterium]